MCRRRNKPSAPPRCTPTKKYRKSGAYSAVKMKQGTHATKQKRARWCLVHPRSNTHPHGCSCCQKGRCIRERVVPPKEDRYPYSWGLVRRTNVTTKGRASLRPRPKRHTKFSDAKTNPPRTLVDCLPVCLVEAGIVGRSPSFIAHFVSFRFARLNQSSQGWH